MASQGDEKTDKAYEALKALLGGIELEVSYIEEFGYLELIHKCNKISTHDNFISVEKFERKDLPDGWRYKSIYDYIRIMINRTVLLKMTYVSSNRPDHYPNSKYRGTSKVRSCGSAVITKLELMSKEEREVGTNRHMKCPCSDACPMERWIRVTFSTARHNVYDIEEVRAAKAYVGYNSKEGRHDVKEITLYDIDKGTHPDLDGISLFGAIHETDCDDSLYEDFPSLDLSMCPKDGPPLAVVVSHPHGCEKKVSIGWCTREEKDFQKPGSSFSILRNFYNTTTCPGSSGAPVKVFTESYDTLFIHSSECLSRNSNCSGKQIVRISTAETTKEENKALDIIDAIDSGDLVQLDMCIADGHINDKNSELFSPLHWATKQNKIKCVHKICEHFIKVKNNTEALNEKHTKTGDTALAIASKNGFKEIVEVLLKFGASQDIVNTSKMFPYQLALKAGHLECSCVLAKYKSLSNKKHRVVKDTISIILETERLDLLEILVDSGCRLDADNKQAKKILKDRCKKHDNSAISVLLKFGLIIKDMTYVSNILDNVRNIDDKFFSNSILWNCLKSVVDSLIANVTNEKVSTLKKYVHAKTKITFLMLICGIAKINYDQEAKYAKCVKLLLEKGADVDKEEWHGETALLRACSNGHTECVKLLLEKGADVDKQNIFRKTALMWACMNGHTECVKLLLEKGADVNKKDKNDQTALVKACRNGHTECVKLLLEKGADVNKKYKNDQTALVKACMNGHAECVKLLLDKGADVDKQNMLDETALMWACMNGHAECVKLLLEKEADVDKEDKSGETALMWACRNGHTECVKLLLEKGADGDKEEWYGETALLWACKNGHTECVKLLLEKAADGDKKDKNDQTALLRACKNGHTECVKLLLEKGADVDKKDILTGVP